MTPRVLISMCLMGIGCRYDGREKGIDLSDLKDRCVLIPFCPEQLGGLSTPRSPVERRGDRVVARDGADVTAAFVRGAAQTALLAQFYGARYALLKARSPSCGVDGVYDGSFTGTLIPGMGVAAEALRAMGVRLYDEAHIEALIEEMDGDKSI